MLRPVREPARLYGYGFYRSGLCPRAVVRCVPRLRVAGRACSYSKRRNNRTTIVRPAIGPASIAMFCEPARLYGYVFCRSGFCPRSAVRCVQRLRVAGRACSYNKRPNNRTTIVRPTIDHASIARFCEPARLYGYGFCRSGLRPRSAVRCVQRLRVAGRACSYDKAWRRAYQLPSGRARILGAASMICRDRFSMRGDWTFQVCQ